jgi:hypothetical protein
MRYLLLLIIVSCAVQTTPKTVKTHTPKPEPSKTESNLCCVSSGLYCEKAEPEPLHTQCYCHNYNTYDGNYLGFINLKCQ